MPYELEYKKVHNTLSKKQNTNMFGFRKGDLINNLWEGTGTRFYCDSNIHKIVLQSTAGSLLSIAVHGTDQNGIEHLAVVADDSSNTLTLQHDTMLLSIMNNNTLENIVVYGSGSTQSTVMFFTPDYYEISLSSTAKAWSTENNLVGHANEDNIIDSYYEEEDYDSFSIKLKRSDEIYQNMCNAIEEHLDSWFSLKNWSKVGQTTVSCTWSINDALSSNSAIVSGVQFGYNIVLVPMRCNPDGTVIGPLKSIVNNRNFRQFSLYNDSLTQGDPSDKLWISASVFFTPIIIKDARTFKNRIYFSKVTDNNKQCLFVINENGAVVSDDDATYGPKDITVVKSRNNKPTYGINDTNWGLWVLGGCGYEEGSYEGSTYICFAIGIQPKLPENSKIVPHSGCSLSKYWVKEDSVMQIRRYPLAIKYKEDSYLYYWGRPVIIQK